MLLIHVFLATSDRKVNEEWGAHLVTLVRSMDLIECGRRLIYDMVS